jgi:hypothetical protein
MNSKSSTIYKLKINNSLHNKLDNLLNSTGVSSKILISKKSKIRISNYTKLKWMMEISLLIANYQI